MCPIWDECLQDSSRSLLHGKHMRGALVGWTIHYHYSCLKARTILIVSLPYHTFQRPLTLRLHCSWSRWPTWWATRSSSPVSMPISGQGFCLRPFTIKMGQEGAKKHPCGHLGAKSIFFLPPLCDNFLLMTRIPALPKWRLLSLPAGLLAWIPWNYLAGAIA